MEPSLSNLPTTMSAVEISRPGGPEVLRLTRRRLPAPKPGEVLIEVHAAGVNRPDVLQRQGQYPLPPGVSDLPGLEVAGTIATLGEGVTRLQVGDSVCALTPGGGYSGYCVTRADHCLPVPRGLTLVEAAALPETYFTVWINVFERARLGPDETLLVQGGTSGIGVAAIQLASALGHRVFATAGSEEKCRACESLGAERGINYRSEDFVHVIREVTRGKGVDVILDMVAGDYLPRELTCLADDGRLAVIAVLGGSTSTINVAELLYRRLTITGSTLRARTNEYKAHVAESLLQIVWPLLEAGRVRPVIHQTFPLAQAARAHELIESGVHIGKIVLVVK